MTIFTESMTATTTTTASGSHMTIITVLAALVGGTFLGSVVQGLYQRRKLGADYAEVVARSATSLLTPLSSRVEELQADLAAERARVQALGKELAAAHEDLAQARLAVRLLRDEMRAARRDVADQRREIADQRREDNAQRERDKRHE